MSKFTERLLQVGVVVALLYYGWGLAKDTMIAQLQANQRAVVAEQQLTQCRAEKK